MAIGFGFAACIAIGAATTAIAAQSPIRFDGQSSELVLSEISERTVRVNLTGFDENGKPPHPPESTILVPFPSAEKFRARELSGDKKLRIGKLRVVVKAAPLTVSVFRADGKLVQELTFDATNSTVQFQTHGPVLGMGEGEHQFDRRGEQYRMRNGQIAPWLATHGATIPVQFLIGTEGWAMFVHRPWGEYDLRTENAIFSARQTPDKEPLELFIVSMDEPADALAEYICLKGRPFIPPKWTVGYFQSHRPLAGPDELVQIVQTFRQSKLPLKPGIYTGTG